MEVNNCIHENFHVLGRFSCDALMINTENQNISPSNLSKVGINENLPSFPYVLAYQLYVLSPSPPPCFEVPTTPELQTTELCISEMTRTPNSHDHLLLLYPCGIIAPAAISSHRDSLVTVPSRPGYQRQKKKHQPIYGALRAYSTDVGDY